MVYCTKLDEHMVTIDEKMLKFLMNVTPTRTLTLLTATKSTFRKHLKTHLVRVRYGHLS